MTYQLMTSWHKACSLQGVIHRANTPAAPGATTDMSTTAILDQYTVITTIHPKTRAVMLFEALPEWQLVLVGDSKSHPITETERLTFLSLDAQYLLGLNMSAASPTNHYARKNIGYLHAMAAGARIIYDTDDDNLPHADWQPPPDFQCAQVAQNASPFINVYRCFTSEHIWPRGFPLDEVNSAPPTLFASESKSIGVWQGLVDEDPDVDAIWRLVFNKRIVFERRAPVYLAAGQYCPFNSQNTFWSREVFPLLYLPTTVRFRFTDILRSYIAQRLMWEHSLHLGFLAPSVYQERNPHNYLDDFKDEIDCYLHIKPIVQLLDSLSLSGDYHRDLRTVYSALLRNRFVAENELQTLDAWLSDLDSIDR